MGNPHARDIVPNINRLVRVVRGAGGKIFWLASATDEEHNAALLNLRLCFADAVFTDDLLTRIETSRTVVPIPRSVLPA